ncbi:Formin-like protein [Melia azedarach]|uniref:Formin-like protein n=1 Tax=Melia azedarach TaxID=155640 RepID=A0ACC1XJP5_MELAZ|nr:Formin-like protein [Melia azedarach]
MAVMFQPWLLLSLFFSVLPFSSCQPQNIETFYPFDIPSPAPEPSITDSPPVLTPLRPPTSPQLLPPPPLPPSLPESSSNDRTIVKAVAATAASTLVIAVFFFFAIKKYVIARRRREKVGDQSSPGGPPPAVVSANEFTRFDGNLKGLIVDENGLDVLYWRKLEEGDMKKDFHKENFHSPRHEEEKEAIQEVPLLRGKSSSSHIKTQPEEDGMDQAMNSRPPPASVSLKTIEEKEPPTQQSTVPPPAYSKQEKPRTTSSSTTNSGEEKSCPATSPTKGRWLGYIFKTTSRA